jgi:hypothetical protein
VKNELYGKSCPTINMNNEDGLIIIYQDFVVDIDSKFFKSNKNKRKFFERKFANGLYKKLLATGCIFFKEQDLGMFGFKQYKYTLSCIAKSGEAKKEKK